MSHAMKRLLLGFVLVLAGCGGDEPSTDEQVWQAYLDHTGFTAANALGTRDEIGDLSKYICEMDGVGLAVFLDKTGGGERLDLAVKLAKVRCPDEVAKLV